MIEEELKHFGIIGMKWRQHKQKRVDKKNARTKKRDETFGKLSDNERQAIIVTSIRSGSKAAERILDLIGKKPTRSFNSALYRQTAESIAKRSLLVIGAGIIGTGLSMVK